MGKKIKEDQLIVIINSNLLLSSFQTSEVSHNKDKQVKKEFLVERDTWCKWWPLPSKMEQRIKAENLWGLGILDLDLFSKALRLRWLWYKWVSPDRHWVNVVDTNTNTNADLIGYEYKTDSSNPDSDPDIL